MYHRMDLENHKECSLSQCKSQTSKKCRVFADINQVPTFFIKNYALYEILNVISIGIQHRDAYGWDVEYDSDVSGPIEHYYFYIDGIYNDVFPHWTLENSIYLVLFKELQTIYPSIKLLSFKEKNYKKCLYRAFNINETDIVTKIKHPRNKIIFTKSTSQADHHTPFLYMEHVSNFYKAIVDKTATREKNIDILYLPRGTSENSRTCDIPIQAHLINHLSNLKNVVIYYTDSTQNMVDQVDLVRRAKVIILNEGGNHGVNGFFAHDSDIIVLGGNGNGCHFQNPCPALIYYDSIKRGNRYFHCPYHIPLPYFFYLLNAVLSKELKPEEPLKVSCWRNCSMCDSAEYSKRPLV